MNDAERAKILARETAERLKDGVAIQRDAAARAHKLLVKAQSDIADILKQAPTDYRRWQLGELQASVKRALTDLQPRLDRTLQADLFSSWEAGSALIDAPFASAGIDLAGSLNAIDVRKLTHMQEFMTDRIKDVTADLAAKINGQLASAAIGTHTPWQAASNIGQVLETGGMKRANMIVRTQLGSAFSVATQERQTQAKVILPGMQKQWRRSGKLHSRYEHDAIDGQVREVDEPFDLPNGVKLMHPRDPEGPVGEIVNCGCTSLPHMASWEVSRPGRQAFTDDELAGSRQKRLISTAFDEAN